MIVAAAAATHSEASDIALRRRLGCSKEFGEGLGRLDTRLLEQVGSVIEIEHDVLERQVVALAVAGLVEVPHSVGDVAGPGPAGKHRVELHATKIYYKTVAKTTGLPLWPEGQSEGSRRE